MQTGFVDGQFQDLFSSWRERNFTDAHRPHGGGYRIFNSFLDPIKIKIHAPQHVRSNAFTLPDHPQQQMFGPDVIVLQTSGLVTGQEKYFTDSLGKTVVHSDAPPFAVIPVAVADGTPDTV